MILSLSFSISLLYLSFALQLPPATYNAMIHSLFHARQITALILAG